VSWFPYSPSNLEVTNTLTLYSGVVLQTAGAYIFFDRAVSSPESSSTIQLPALLRAGLEYHAPVTALTATPAIFSDLIALCGPDDIARLRILESVGVGGASTVESIFQWAVSNGIRYWDCSGATEAAGTIARRCAWDPSQRENGLQVIPELIGLLRKERLEDNHGELVIRGTVCELCFPQGLY
jgi:hypothetical protein